MPTASFSFGQSSEYECRMVCSYFGRERYFVNGLPVFHHWGFTPSGTREFAANGHHIKIMIVGGLKRVDAKAFVDGALVASDLFRGLNAEYTAKLRPHRLILRAGIWFLAALAVFAAIKAFSAGA